MRSQHPETLKYNEYRWQYAATAFDNITDSTPRKQGKSGAFPLLRRYSVVIRSVSCFVRRHRLQ
ncbi:MULTISPECIES: hypothetical protein [unclassified Morganella (in: enterobacteria)]|uniref:hypothetical protein n=1 Tax=unclassified Morganella (in: enterobacteria) TaxID=2676694 RepID=UPI002942FE2F|nr:MULTISPECIES: hypothetical protein [unclassified Morganella (in: enterobacteria)]